MSVQSDLEWLIPDLKQKVDCPGRFLRPTLQYVGKYDELPQSENPYSGEVAPCYKNVHLSVVVQHLNDRHRWTREEIADWLDTLDLDLTFPTEPPPRPALPLASESLKSLNWKSSWTGNISFDFTYVDIDPYTHQTAVALKTLGNAAISVSIDMSTYSNAIMTMIHNEVNNWFVYNDKFKPKPEPAPEPGLYATQELNDKGKAMLDYIAQNKITKETLPADMLALMPEGDPFDPTYVDPRTLTDKFSLDIHKPPPGTPAWQTPVTEKKRTK